MGGLCLPTIGHCMLPTAVHAEQTNIRDTIKTDLSKGFFTFFFWVWKNELSGNEKDNVSFIISIIYLYCLYYGIWTPGIGSIRLLDPFLSPSLSCTPTCCWRYRVLVLAVILSHQVSTLIFMASIVTSCSSCQSMNIQGANIPSQYMFLG